MKRIPCRKGCGACCIFLAIAAPVPGMPGGKPAGTRCIHLTEENLCSLHGGPEYPKVCKDFQATEELCGRNAKEAEERLTRLNGFPDGFMGP